MILLLPLLISGLIGLNLVYASLKTVPLTHKPLLVSALSLPLGLGVSSIILFWAYFFAGPWAKTVTVAGNCLLLLFLAGSHFQLFAPRNIRSYLAGGWRSMLQSFKVPHDKKSLALYWLTWICALIFTFLLFQYVYYVVGKIAWNIYGGWDARYFWNLKAKFLFRAPDHWRDMFHPGIDFAHPDYPLLIPGAVTWGWIVGGKEYLLWPPVVDFVFFTSTCLLILWYVGSRYSWISGFLASSYFLHIHMFRFWSTTQYADIPLAFFISASVILFVVCVKIRHSRLFLLVGILTGLAAWTKNEGLPFVLSMSAVIMIASMTYLQKENRLRRLMLYIAGLAIVLTVVFSAKVFLNTAGGEYWGSGRTATDYLSRLFSSIYITKMIGAAYWVFSLNFQQWTGLWTLFYAACAVACFRRFRNFLWLIPLFVLLINLSYFITLHLTQVEIKFQLATALLRLMMHSGVLALVFACEVFHVPAPEASTSTHPSGGK